LYVQVTLRIEHQDIGTTVGQILGAHLSPRYGADYLIVFVYECDDLVCRSHMTIPPFLTCAMRNFLPPHSSFT
jgi:hypothetical protein